MGMFTWKSSKSATGSKEARASGFTDALIGALLGNAGGVGIVNSARTAAMEISAGLWGRAFASATVNEPGMTRTLTPEVLATIGRSLIRTGEIVYLIEIIAGRVELVPVASHYVRGDYSPKSWRYRINLAGASSQYTRYVVHDQVLHFRYAVSPQSPYRGISPIQFASDTGALSAALEKRLSEESGAKVGYIMPYPERIDDESADDEEEGRLTKFVKGLSGAAGRLVMVESAAGGFGDKPDAPTHEYKQIRYGSEFQESAIALRSAVMDSILALNGVPVELAKVAQGTSGMASFRRFVHSSVVPIAKQVATELSSKLDTEISLNFDELRASDVSAKARAYKAFRDSGLEHEQAANYAGLE